MPRPRRTDEEIEEMRQRILDAAVEVLHDEGPGGLSIRAIADCAGVSHMVLYSYFDDHDELMSTLRQQQRKRFIDRRAEMLTEAREGDVCKIVRKLLEHYVEFANKNPDVFRFIWTASRAHQSGKHPRFHGHAKKGFRAEMHHLAELIEIGIERGVFIKRDVHIAALTVSGMINGPLVMYQIPGRITKETLKKLEIEVVDAGMHYLTGQE